MNKNQKINVKQIQYSNYIGKNVKVIFTNGFEFEGLIINFDEKFLEYIQYINNKYHEIKLINSNPIEQIIILTGDTI